MKNQDSRVIWGAITGTLGLLLAGVSHAWQVRGRRRAPGPKLKGALSMMAQKHHLFGGVVGDQVLIHVTNVGPLQVRVVSAGFLIQRKSGKN